MAFGLCWAALFVFTNFGLALGDPDENAVNPLAVMFWIKLVALVIGAAIFSERHEGPRGLRHATDGRFSPILATCAAASALDEVATIEARCDVGSVRQPGVIVSVIAAACVPGAAFAYCPGADTTVTSYRQDYYSVRTEFSRAEFVVEAIATNETWLGEDGKTKPLLEPYGAGDKRPWGLAAPYMGAWYDIRVTRSFKGQPPANLRLFSENSTARFWLNKGEHYLLFISREAFDEPVGQAMTIEPCGNSGILSPTLVRQLEILAAEK